MKGFNFNNQNNMFSNMHLTNNFKIIDSHIQCSSNPSLVN